MLRLTFFWALSFVLILAAVGCTTSKGQKPNLTKTMAELVPSTTTTIDPTNDLSGLLRLTSDAKRSQLALIDGTPLADDPRRILPDITIELVQHQQQIIPLQRSLTFSDNLYWDYIVGVGKLWLDTPTQQLHMALPFALVEKNQNCVHNGIIKISFDTNNQPSDFYYQISSETCAYFKADFWGTGNSEYHPHEFNHATTVIEQFQQQQAQQLPRADISELTQLNPSVSVDALGLKASIKTDDMTLYGMVVDGIHYQSDCMTRAGAYPFCEQLVLPSYSTAKSIFGGLALFTLEQRYGDAMQQQVSQWVDECDTADWQGVTFAHLLNMNTGLYGSKKYGVDEASPEKLAFFDASDHQGKLSFACQHYARKSPLAETFVYHTSDTYLLGTALNAYLKSKMGEDADIFNDIILKDIFTPLQLSDVSNVSRRTTDNKQQPFAGYGLFFTADDIARLSLFIQQQSRGTTSENTLAQRPLLNALQQGNEPSGLVTAYPHIRYHLSFWARNVTQVGQCNTPSWLPFMSGFGGITVALLPANNSYYYFSDSHQYNWASAVPELAKLQTLCH